VKKALLILLLGLVLATVGFSGIYYLRTTACRTMMRDPQPELAWLKKEFNLGDAEFKRVVQLHEAYLPQCAERCRQIERQNQKIQLLLSKSSEVTAEVQQLITEGAKMRAACETEMLKHFVQVSRTMPPEQGQRYLVWVERQTFLSSQGMEQRHHFVGESSSEGMDHESDR
jgi:hypothetical protein